MVALLTGTLLGVLAAAAGIVVLMKNSQEWTSKAETSWRSLAWVMAFDVIVTALAIFAIVPRG